MNRDARRYDAKVDLSLKNTSHTQLVLLTGRNKNVLEIGPATGYVTEVLQRRGCRVTAIENDPIAAGVAAKFCHRIIVGDVEEIDFREALGEEQFDVVMFGDVLEHLVDPKSVLVKVRPYVRPRGYVVASMPNITHGSVRLMLLDGDFSYTEKGLLDRTHLRFFSRKGVEALFDEAEYDIRVWRHTSTDALTDPLAADVALAEADFPPTLLDALRQDPEAFTYQFVVRAYPRQRRRRAKRASEGAQLSTGARGEATKALWHLDESLHRQRHALVEKEAALADKDQHIGNIETALAAKQALLAEKEQQIADVEATLVETEAQLRDIQMQYQAATSSVGYRLLERIRRVIHRLAPEDTRRRRLFVAASRRADIILNQGWGPVLRRLPQVWRWGPRLLRMFRAPAQQLSLDDQYQLWLRSRTVTPARAGAIKREAAQLDYRPKVSIITPVHNTDPSWLRAAIESVRSQLYENWELCIGDDGSTQTATRDVLQEYADQERIKITYLESNQGIAAASNEALALATGEFVAFLDSDDELKPDALYHVVKLLNEQPDLDFIYSDEDKRGPDGRLREPFFKPDWSPDLLLSVNYLTHFAVYRKRIVDDVGGLRSECDFSQDYDLTLRVTERTERIGHISLPLYSWRMVPHSSALEVAAKPGAIAAAKRALADAMERRGIEAEIQDGPVKTTYRVRYNIQGEPLVSIIVLTRDRADYFRRCLRSVEERTSYSNYEIIVVHHHLGERGETSHRALEGLRWRVHDFYEPYNYSKMNNLGARLARGEHLVFLNDDTEVIEGEWLEAMLEHSQRPDVAAVGARLLYPDGRPQHEGTVIGLGGGSSENVDTRGYFGLGQLVRNVSAVTAACMMVRRQVFEEMNGLDEKLAVVFNDVDYCLRARERGYLVVYTPYALLYHHEGATRGKHHPPAEELYYRRRWGEPGQYRDPYYNPNLSVRVPFNLKVD